MLPLPARAVRDAAQSKKPAFSAMALRAIIPTKSTRASWVPSKIDLICESETSPRSRVSPPPKTAHHASFTFLGRMRTKTSVATRTSPANTVCTVSKVSHPTLLAREMIKEGDHMSRCDSKRQRPLLGSRSAEGYTAQRIRGACGRREEKNDASPTLLKTCLCLYSRTAEKRSSRKPSARIMQRAA